MPNTPVFGITYPCLEYGVTTEDFYSFSTSLEAAIATVDAVGTQAILPPHAGVFVSQSVAVGVATNCAVSQIFFSEPPLQTTIGATSITVPITGMYQISQSVSVSGFTTLTSLKVSITVNGVIEYAYKQPAPSLGITNNSIPHGLVKLIGGDAVRVNVLWTGTGGPATASGEFTLQLVSRVT